MNSFIQYIQGAGEGIKSLLVGMRTSIRVFFRPKVTEQYPENRATLHISDRFRGTLVMPHDANNQHRCIGCGICQAACPNDTIHVVTETQTDEEGKKKRVLLKYEYNLGSCMFCQLCVNACPHDAICFSNEFENAVFEKEKLLLTLNCEGSTVVKK